MLIYGPNTLGSGWGVAGEAGEESRGAGHESGAGALGKREGEGRGEGEEHGYGAGHPIPPRGVVRFVIPELPLFPGDYLFSASAYDPSLSIAYDHHDMSYFFSVVAGAGAGVGGAVSSREFGLVKIKSSWTIEP